MIITIPDSWLREYLDTNASYREIAEFLTLSGPTVEDVDRRNDDVIYTIELTPNRIDLASVIGMAREAAAIIPHYNKKAALTSMPQTELILPDTPADDEMRSLDTTFPAELCSHSLVLVMNNVRVGPSPQFMKERLEKSGVRSINNVVDISNYVMLETGQPLHIFDYDAITGHTMTMRESREGETITPLDGSERVIPTGSIVIEDADRLIDLCGIMGAANSGVTEKTTSVVLFVQRYDPVKVGRTARSMNLITDAALRFEKNLAPQVIPQAFNRTRELLEAHAGATPASTVLQTGKFEDAQQEVEVEVDLATIQEYLDERIESEEAAAFLESLGFSVEIESGSFTSPKLVAQVPHYRATDVRTAEDLVEEITRLYGYQHIGETLPSGAPPVARIDHTYHWEAVMEDTLVSAGFTEAYNYSYVSEEMLQHIGLSPRDAITVTNPLTSDLAYMRPTLLCNLLQNTADNQHRYERIQLFEHERISSPTENGGLPDEEYHLTGVVYGTEAEDLFFRAKAAVEGVLAHLHVTRSTITPAKRTNPFWTERKHGGCENR